MNIKFPHIFYILNLDYEGTIFNVYVFHSKKDTRFESRHTISIYFTILALFYAIRLHSVAVGHILTKITDHIYTRPEELLTLCLEIVNRKDIALARGM
jgi:hypothetical protein